MCDYRELFCRKLVGGAHCDCRSIEMDDKVRATRDTNDHKFPATEEDNGRSPFLRSAVAEILKYSRI